MSTLRAMPTVCVTGASGFIASHVVEQLLRAGHNVRGTVRNKDNAAKTQHLTSLPGAAERLTLYSADLAGAPGSFDEAVAGCDYVMHTASPFTLNVRDPMKDLIEPAVNGVKLVLSSCAKESGRTIKRVILTSSLAAITDEPREEPFTEADWNTKSTTSRNPYYKSKVDAERYAHDFVAREKPSFDLVAINPSMVFGPSHTKSVNETVKSFLQDAVSGQMPMRLDLTIGFVDVRDVAAAHIAAMTKGEAGSRYICAAENATFNEYIDYLIGLGISRENGFKIPTTDMSGGVGTMIVKTMTRVPFVMPRDAATFMRLHLGRAIKFDNSKIKNELGISFRPWRETVKDTAFDMAKWGNIKEIPGRS